MGVLHWHVNSHVHGEEADVAQGFPMWNDARSWVRDDLVEAYSYIEGEEDDIRALLDALGSLIDLPTGKRTEVLIEGQTTPDYVYDIWPCEQDDCEVAPYQPGRPH